jgi:hypothetical protein
LAAPLIVKYENLGVVGWIIVAAMVGAIVWAFLSSSRPIEDFAVDETATAAAD